MTRPLFPVIVSITLAGFAIAALKLILPATGVLAGASPGEVGVITACFAVGWPIFGLRAGVFIDRRGRRRALLTGEISAFLGASLLTAAAFCGTPAILVLCAIGLVCGIGEVLVETAGQSILPDLVQRDELPRANSMLGAARAVGIMLCGPVTATFLLDISVWLAASVAFAAAAMALVALSTVRGADIVHDGGLDVFGGVTTIRRSPELLALTIALAVMTVAWGGWMVLIVLYALSPDLLRLSASGLGAVMAALGFGGLAGALGYSRLKAWLGMRLLLALDAIGTVVFLIVPALGGGFVMTAIAAFIAGIGGVTWAVAIGAYQQATIVPGQLGRSVAAYRWFGWSGFFVGSLAAGLLAEQAGTMVALAVFTVIAAAFLLAFPFLLGRGKMHNIELSLSMRDGEMAAARG